MPPLGNLKQFILKLFPNRQGQIYIYQFKFVLQMKVFHLGPCKAIFATVIPSTIFQFCSIKPKVDNEVHIPPLELQPSNTFHFANEKRMQFLQKGMIDQSREVAKAILASLEQENGGKNESYLNFSQEVGIDFMQACSFQDALQMFLEIKKTQLQKGMRHSLTYLTTLNQISTVYSRLQNHEEAILYLRQCLQIVNTLLNQQCQKSNHDQLFAKVSICLDLLQEHQKTRQANLDSIGVQYIEECIQILPHLDDPSTVRKFVVESMKLFKKIKSNQQTFVLQERLVKCLKKMKELDCIKNV